MCSSAKKLKTFWKRSIKDYPKSMISHCLKSPSALLFPPSTMSKILDTNIIFDPSSTKITQTTKWSSSMMHQQTKTSKPFNNISRTTPCSNRWYWSKIKNEEPQCQTSIKQHINTVNLMTSLPLSMAMTNFWESTSSKFLTHSMSQKNSMFFTPTTSPSTGITQSRLASRSPILNRKKEKIYIENTITPECSRLGLSEWEISWR